MQTEGNTSVPEGNAIKKQPRISNIKSFKVTGFFMFYVARVFVHKFIVITSN